MPSESNLSDDSLQERTELLETLSSMGVKLPASTKLPVDALQERLAKALDRSQRYAELFPRRKPNLRNLQPWTEIPGKTLEDAFTTYNIHEMTMGSVGSFNEVRIMLAETVARMYGNGSMSVFVSEDGKKDRLVKMKVTGAYRTEDGTPLLAVEYKLGRVCDDDEDGIKMLNTPGAHTILRKLLGVNARHAKEDKSRSGTTGTIPSYLLPLSSLSQFDIGSLCKDVGCIVCGSPSKNRCSRCQSVSYCGKDCQRSDWQRHKPSCLALDTGTWIRVEYEIAPFQSLLNRTERTPFDITGRTEPTAYGSDSFIIKIQLNAIEARTMLVYDRKRSFTGQIDRSKDPESFRRLENVVKTGYMGMKAYLWAKYIGNHNLTICLDRLPAQSSCVW